MNKIIETKVREITAQILNVPVEKVLPETAIGDLEEWDSLRHLQIIAAIEKNFGFRFTPDELIDLEDIRGIANEIEKRTQK